MGANAQTTVPTFVASQVLTADQQNQSARTGVPVFATTVTRDAAFGGAGEKTLAEGQLCYLEDANVVQYYDGAAWATVGPSTPGGLVFIKSETIGTTVSSVTVTGAFSSTYDNYLVLVSGGVATADGQLALTFGAVTTNYYWSLDVRSWTNSAFTDVAANSSNIAYAAITSANYLNGVIQISGPNLAKNTVVNAQGVRAATNGTGGNMRGYLNDTTQHTAFTLTTNAGTMTGGTVKVYGYANS